MEVERTADFEIKKKVDRGTGESTEDNPKFFKFEYGCIQIFRSKYQMFQSLFDQRKVHIMVEMDKATLQNALDEVFPMIDDLELSVNRDVPLEEYRQVSNKLEGVRNLVTGLKPMIKPLPYSPKIVAWDDQTNKCNEGLESLLGPKKFQDIFKFES